MSTKTWNDPNPSESIRIHASLHKFVPRNDCTSTKVTQLKLGFRIMLVRYKDCNLPIQPTKFSIGEYIIKVTDAELYYK